MEKIAVFVNDVAHARQILGPMLQSADPVHWIIVACPPTLTRHIGRWVSHSAREQWRERWAVDVFAALEPALRVPPSNTTETLVAKRPLVEVSQRLEARLGTVRLLDARRPRAGKPDEPISAAMQPGGSRGRANTPFASATGLTLVMLAFAD